MLGHMTVKYLKDKGHQISTTEYKFPSLEFFDLVNKYEGDYIVNCIGAIPQKTKDFTINTELPIWLSQNAKSKVIHPGTDCEMDDDAYGVSKKTASDYIKNHSTNTKIIKASIIGPEVGTKFSLLDWFLNSEGNVTGYTSAMWNGITTLEWAKQCEMLLHNWDMYKVQTIVSSECISKYDLLTKIKNTFNKDIEIVELENLGSNKCLQADSRTNNIEIQLNELKEYYYKNIK